MILYRRRYAKKEIKCMCLANLLRLTFFLFLLASCDDTGGLLVITGTGGGDAGVDGSGGGE